MICPHCGKEIQTGQDAARRPDTVPLGPWLHRSCFDAESPVCPVEVGVWLLIGASDRPPLERQYVHPLHVRTAARVGNWIDRTFWRWLFQRRLRSLSGRTTEGADSA